MAAALTKRQRNERLRAQLDQDFNTFRAQYQDINDYIMPSRGRFFISDNNRGDRRNNKIYDPTAYLALRTLSSGMMAGITSPARNWKRLTMGDPDLAEFGPVKVWLAAVDNRMSGTFLKSNLYNVLPTGYGDLGGFGTAAIGMEEDLNEVSRFSSFPVGTYRIAKDYRGRVNVFLREFRLTVRQLVEEFGKQNDAGEPDWSVFSQQVRNMWDQGNYETWIDVVHIVQPNQEYNPRHLDSKFKKYASCYYEKGAAAVGDEDKMLREKGYDFFPVLVPRWQVTGQDVYGTDCPGMVAIGDVKQLQQGEKRALQAIDKMINPAMSASSNLKTAKASIISGDITYLDDDRSFFRPTHDVRLDLSHLESKQTQCRQRIQRTFFEDLFLMLAQSDRRDYTATEIVERKEEKLLAVGPVLEQLNQDVLDPLIDNQFFLMNQQGLIPPPPQEIAGQELKVEYISVMAQAQRLVGIGGLDRLLQMTTQVIQLNPGSSAKFDFDQFMDEYAEALGTAPAVIRSDDKVEEIRASQAQAQAAQQKMEMVQQGATAAKDLSQANMSQDSALTRLLQNSQAGQLVEQ